MHFSACSVRIALTWTIFDYFFLFSYLFRVRLVGWVWVGVFIVWFVTVRERNGNIQLRCQGFSPPKRERPLLGREEPWERHWKIIYTFWVIVLRIKILGSNPQKSVNSFLFYSFSLLYISFQIITYYFVLIECCNVFFTKTLSVSLIGLMWSHVLANGPWLVIFCTT